MVLTIPEPTQALPAAESEALLQAAASAASVHRARTNHLALSVLTRISSEDIDFRQERKLAKRAVPAPYPTGSPGKANVGYRQEQEHERLLR